MWNQLTTDASSEDKQNYDNKNKSMTSEQDSGFISSEGCFTSEEQKSASSVSAQQQKHSNSATSGDSKEINTKKSNNNFGSEKIQELSTTNDDSGFITQSSDSLTKESNLQLQQQHQQEEEQKIINSSAQLQQQEQQPTTKMILDNCVNSNLNQWFSKMQLGGNNLSGNYRRTNNSRFPLAILERCYTQDSDGDTKLHLAILGQLEQTTLKLIKLAPYSDLLDIRNDDAHAPLHLAVLTRQPNIVRELLWAGAKPSIRDSNGNSPLHLACFTGDLKCVEALLSNASCTPSAAAAVNEHHQEFQQKLNERMSVQKIDLEQRNYDGEYCVHIAAQRNDIDVLRHLVNYGADINAREGKSGYTALHYACETSNSMLVKFLLTECKQLKVETRTYGLWTAYQLAAEHNNEQLMLELEHFGAERLIPPQSDGDDDDDEHDSSDDGQDDDDINYSDSEIYTNVM